MVGRNNFVVGMLPVSRLQPSSSCSNAVKRLMLHGMLPVSALSFKCSSCSRGRPPMDSGMRPIVRQHNRNNRVSNTAASQFACAISSRRRTSQRILRKRELR